MQLAAQTLEYKPRRPEEGILHRVVRDHLEDFLLEAELRFENGLPDFVEEEMRRFLGCGHLASGFVRLNPPSRVQMVRRYGEIFDSRG